MPAPSPYTPPQPIEPPHQQTPRLSCAQRLTTPPNPRRLSTPDPDREESFQTPVAARRKRFCSATTVRRQLLPRESSSQPSTSWFEESSTSLDQFEESSTPLDQGDQSLDEDLRDPEFFIKLFSRIDGPILHADTELREKLERYLLKVNLYQEDTASMPGTSKDKKAGPSNVNFAEAALVVQGSTRIYGKKVDLLFNAAVQLFRLLSTPFEEQEEEEGEDAGPADTPRAAKNSKKLRLGFENRDLAEDIALVESMKLGARIEQKKSSRPRLSELIKNLSSMRPRGSVRFLPPNIPRLVRKTKTLGTNDKEVEKINCRRVPQYGQGMESRGFIDEYRLNEVIRKADFMLVEHFVPFEPENLKSIGAEGHTQAGKALHPCQCDSGIDSCPSSVYNPVECSDSVIWEGSSIGMCGETDVMSCGDDGFISEGVHEEGISELEEEMEVDVNKECGDDVMGKESEPKELDSGSCEMDAGETDTGVSEMERSGTESSGVFSENGPIDESQCVDSTGDERVSESHPEAANQTDDAQGLSMIESERVPESHPEAANQTDDAQGLSVLEGERIPESQPEAANQTEEERVSEAQADSNKEVVPEKVTSKECGSKSTQNSNSPASELKEVEFTPTPRRNKRKLKNFKLPCKLSLLLPEKKKRMTKNTRAAELWRPSQSPCSSVSSHYPQSPMSFAPASPDPHSLGQLMLQDDDHHEDIDNLSESDNEGEYFDPPADGQPQINYWIQNHQKDLMSAGQPTTLSDQVAQWQELIMPRLEANLRFGPYSHVRYAPVLMELLTRKGWPPPENSFPYNGGGTEEDEELYDEDGFLCDRTSRQIASRTEPQERCVHRFKYDAHFHEPEEADFLENEEVFLGFQTPKRMRRRGYKLSETQYSPQKNSILYTSLSKVYHWGCKRPEVEILDKEQSVRQWANEKRDWLQSKVRANRLQRNWDEWNEENDNIETNTELDVHLPSVVSEDSEPVVFTTVFSGFRKEEVSRLLFTALHLTSQGVLEISADQGVINSMKMSFHPNER